MTADDYISVHQAALRLKVCAETIRRWVKSGRLPAIKHPSGRVRILAAAVENIYTTPATFDDKPHI
jgi:excisionase family DNA binding protein